MFSCFHATVTLKRICGSPRYLVENEHYSVAYSDRTLVFKALDLRTSVKGGAHTRYVEASHIDASTQRI